jgi:hypothetical protein
MTKEKCGKKSIWRTHKIWRRWPANAARFWRKSKKKDKNVLPFNNLASLNQDFGEKIAKKGKKSLKTNYGNHPMPATCKAVGLACGFAFTRGLGVYQ